VRNSSKGKILLINPNTIKPLIAPIGLDYVAESLNKRGFTVEILDLALIFDKETAISDYFEKQKADIVGITVRNTDDCYYASQAFFIPQIRDIVEEIRKHDDAPIVLGGCSFSLMPRSIMHFCGADFGIKGEGEESFRQLAEVLIAGNDYSDIPGLVQKENGGFRVNEPLYLDLEKLDFGEREIIDNSRYFKEGGQGNIETKRGCNKGCIYCADPVIKGSKVRLRSPQSVAAEMERLHSEGIYCFHLCDSEFNNPLDHALAVCEEILDSSLAGEISWYAYASPTPFSKNSALLMKEAGCIGIDFGVDSGSDPMLAALGRDFTTEDVVKTAEICNQVGVTFMYDLLIGGPGESKETIKESIGLMKKINPSCVGISLGVRIYPGTKLEKMVKAEGLGEENENLLGSIENNEDFLRPIFYLSSNLGKHVGDFLDELIGDDRKFFFANPKNRSRNYNYNENEVLVSAVQNGYRGAYWDILRRLGNEELF